jgi:hypothetical protein
MTDALTLKALWITASLRGILVSFNSFSMSVKAFIPALISLSLKAISEVSHVRQASYER